MSRDATTFEDILQLAQRKNLRLLGFCAAAPGAGTTTCTVQAAATAARAGFRTLCIDGSRGAQGSGEAGAENGWYPGGGRAACTVFASAAGFDFVGVDASDGRRQLFNNLAAARASLLSDFSEYDFIMMDLAPMLEGREESINPLAAATICEAAFLICRAGIETSREVETALNRLRAGGCRLEGVILNEAWYETPGQALAARATRWARWMPRLSARVGAFARRSELLN